MTPWRSLYHQSKPLGVQPGLALTKVRATQEALPARPEVYSNLLLLVNLFNLTTHMNTQIPIHVYKA